MSVLDHPTRQLSSVPRPDGADALPASFVVQAWWDPKVAAEGFDPRGAYVERFWLGVVGPSVVFLLRRLSRGLEEHPNGFRVSTSDTARAIGLGSGTGRQSPIARTIERACLFKVMRRPEPDRLEVRTHLPKLTRRQLERLPLAVRNTHDAWLAHPANGRPTPPTTAS